MNIKWDEKIKEHSKGVYRIDFGNGKFYIGASGELWQRVTVHIRSIKSGFKTAMTCKAMKLMAGFDGEVNIHLLENVECPDIYYGTPRKVLERESFYISQCKNDPNCLNWDMRAYKRKPGLKCYAVPTP